MADATTLLTTTALGPSLQGLAFDKKGNLFASRDATTGNFNTGAVFQIDPSNGTILQYRCVRSYLSNRAFRRPSERRSVHRRFLLGRRIGQPRHVAHLRSGHRHAQNHGVHHAAGNAERQYFVCALGHNLRLGYQRQPLPRIAQISGTDGPMTPTVSILPNFQVAALGVLANGTQANGDAEYLFLNPFDATTNSSLGIGTADLTTNPPSAGVTLATGSGANNLITRT